MSSIVILGMRYLPSMELCISHIHFWGLQDRDPAFVDIATVIAIYVEDVAHKHSRPKETAGRLGRILDFFGAKRLNYLNQKACESYVTARGSVAAARRELEDLRAAVRHHREAGLCIALTPVVLSDNGEPRERWLTRLEAARLLLAAWRLREKQGGKLTDRPTAKHVARFILTGLSLARGWVRFAALPSSLPLDMVGSTLSTEFSTVVPQA